MSSPTRICRWVAGAALCSALLCPGSAHADRVLLKNGRHMEGKATDQRKDGGGVVLEVFDASGRKVATVRLKASEVAEVLAGEGAKASDASTTVTVNLKGDAAYGSGRIDGVVADNSSQDKLVLKVPGGVLQVERSDKIEVSARDPNHEIQAGTPAEAGKIRTTSEVTLRNGRKLKGDILPSLPQEALKLRVGALGILSVDRKLIADDGIRSVEGSIELPAPPAPRVEPSPAEPMKEGKEGVDIEAMKKQIREQVMKELIDAAIDARIDHMLRADAGRDMIDELRGTLSDAEVEELEAEAHELTRERTRNRARAEDHLAAAGPAALPFLRSVSRSPNEFARRAVQRVLVQVNDVRGAPIAIAGMNDPDSFVRELAQEAVQALLPSDIRYDANGPDARIAEAQEAYEEVWARVARSILLEQIASR